MPKPTKSHQLRDLVHFLFNLLLILHGMELGATFHPFLCDFFNCLLNVFFIWWNNCNMFKRPPVTVSKVPPRWDHIHTLIECMAMT